MWYAIFDSWLIDLHVITRDTFWLSWFFYADIIERDPPLKMLKESSYNDCFQCIRIHIYCLFSWHHRSIFIIIDRTRNPHHPFLSIYPWRDLICVQVWLFQRGMAARLDLHGTWADVLALSVQLYLANRALTGPLFFQTLWSFPARAKHAQDSHGKHAAATFSAHFRRLFWP